MLSKEMSKVVAGVLVALIIWLAYLTAMTQHRCRAHLRGEKVIDMKGVFNPSMDKGLLFLREAKFDWKNPKRYYSHIKVLSSDSMSVGTPDDGLEDPRGLVLPNNDYIICATKHDSPVFRPVLVTKEGVEREYVINRDLAYNKNWCPFLHEGKLYIHTDTSPVWRVYSLDLSMMKMTLVAETDYPQEGNLRCSTTWREYDDKHYLVGLHTKKTSGLVQMRLVLALADKRTLLPVKRTVPFCIEPDDCNRVQFLSGLEVDDKYVYFGYGVDDERAVITKVKREDVNALINECAEDHHADVED